MMIFTSWLELAERVGLRSPIILLLRLEMYQSSVGENELWLSVHMFFQVVILVCIHIMSDNLIGTSSLFPIVASSMDLTPLDHIILMHGENTVNTERLSSYVQQTKLHPAPSAEDFQREIGRLRHEVAFHQQVEMVLMRLFKDMREAHRLLEDAHAEAYSKDDFHVAFLSMSSQSRYAALFIKKSLRQVSSDIASLGEWLLHKYGICLDDPANNYNIF
jgi:hypothetical protein